MFFFMGYGLFAYQLRHLFQDPGSEAYGKKKKVQLTVRKDNKYENP